MKTIRLALVLSMFPWGGFAAITEVGSAVASGTGTGASVTHGLTILANDVVLAFTSANNGVTTTDNNGTTPFTESVNRLSTAQVAADNRIVIGSRVSAGSEPSAYAWTNSGSVAWTIIIRVFRGVASTVWDVEPGAGNLASSVDNGDTATSTNITTLTNGALGMIHNFTDGTERFSGQTNDYTAEVEVGTVLENQVSYTKNLSEAGAVGTVSITLSGSNDWTIYHFALKPTVSQIRRRFMHIRR